ncbi:MAG: DUF4302 domain-containing protein [Prevotellaceae bacterium]|jgi:hypothetical protein|nr:DUF4302 domain-containing protein [Prevotellaceae bacterium]
MKKILLLCLIAPFWLSSCLFDDKDLFEQSASERMEARLREAKTLLLSSPGGWLMSYYPSSTQEYGGYTLFLRFSTGNRVTVASEIEVTTGDDAEKTYDSFYDIISDDGPVLTFNTGNSYIHFFSNPYNPHGIGADGAGMEGDYEFIILEATSERITLKGKKTGNRVILTPIDPTASWSALMQEYIDAAARMSFKRGRYNVGLPVPVKRNYRQLSFTHPDNKGDTIVTTMGFRYTLTGIQFYDTLKINDIKVKEMRYVGGTAPYFEDVGGSGVRLAIEIWSLSRQLVEDKEDRWGFSYSGLGSYGQSEWDVPKTVLPNVAFPGDNGRFKLYFAWMGYDFVDGREYCFNFQTYNNSTNEEFSGIYYGAYAYEVSIVNDNQVKFQRKNLMLGRASEFYSNASFNRLIAPIGSSLSSSKTFTLTCDNLQAPTWILLTDTNNPNNTIKLSSTDIYLPFDK